MKTILSIEKRDGYEIRKEQLCGQEFGLPDGECIDMDTAYNPSGDYIGDPGLAQSLVENFGIKPELADTDHQTCSIGFSEHSQSWFGWSHRGMAAFKIGDKLFDANHIPDEQTPFQQCGVVTIETLAQARQAAINFADYVSG